MDFQAIHDKQKIFGFLRKNPALHMYSIGDLDDFFWPKTTWYVLTEMDAIQAIVLMYVGMPTPTVLAFCDDEAPVMHQLIERLKPIFPNRFNAHFSPGLIEHFGRQNVIEYYGYTYKMQLTKKVFPPDDNRIRTLGTDDLNAIEVFYKEAYPNNWFDSRMLETGKYYGLFIDNKLVGVSGVHVYSEVYKVAALGNIATHPDFRGQQIAYNLTSALCADLQKTVNYIGLNVKVENEYAIKSYQKVGFEIVASYDECYLKNVVD